MTPEHHVATVRARRVRHRLEVFDGHVHLEGTLEAALASVLAARHGTGQALAKVQRPAPGERWPGPMAFLQVMRAIGDYCLRAPGDYAETARAYVGRLAEQGASGALITIGLARAVRLSQDPDEILAAVSEVVRSCERSGGVSIRLLVGVDRASPDRAEEHIGVALRHAGPVVGIDLQGVPSAPLSSFGEAAKTVHASGMIVRVHAGEFEGPRSVWEAIETVGATRIAHGMRAIEDLALVAELARRGTILDLALTSNVALRNCASYTDHPLRRLVSAGVRVTLGTDDPAYFHTSIADEYAHARALGLRTHDVRGMRRHTLLTLSPSPQPEQQIRPDESEEWPADR